ncbi:unnamed protein product [Chondrus crispus]|uniref:methionine adenosyltransferase n=1 Tax=Chondrus crispus TaxID=2769 RepID=R7Q588_CHOCR|nr:unnamed protein product [Chondrus crispus]CDF32993.1 unnamed protein product [Chondrus crispus]|eukprot:XP_005712796.1 unnamed protein product [Chondrus crispus]
MSGNDFAFLSEYFSSSCQQLEDKYSDSRITTLDLALGCRCLEYWDQTVYSCTEFRTFPLVGQWIATDLMEKVIKKVIPDKYLDDRTILVDGDHLNPSGRFVIGGSDGDAGLTRRKISIETYGGWGAHGGGAFSRKHPTKVDRSAAYAGRWIAKSVVAAGLADRCLVQVSYGIGIAEPLSIFVDTYGTGSKSDAEITDIVKANFDLRPGHIIRELNLLRPIYSKTAAYGHFGRDDPDFTWEKPKTLKF